MKSKQNLQNQMSYWQLIFSQSKVNGAPYKDDDLPSLSGTGREILICSGDVLLANRAHHSTRTAPL